MNETVRTGLVTASLLASLAGLAASPAAGEGGVRSADRALVQVPASEDQRGHHHRPPPPPTLATFTGVVSVGRTRYTYILVGTNPQLRRAQNVVVPVAVIPMSMQFSDGTVLDTSQPDACLGGLSAVTVTMQSPLFQDFDYGEGPRQFLEQIRRLEFWQFTGPGTLNPGYSVRLSPTVLPTQTLALSPTSFTEEVPCLATGGSQRMGHVDFGDFNNLLVSQVMPQFPQWGVNASWFVLILLPNMDFHIPGAPYLVAYHGAFYPPHGGVVTYAAAQLGLVGPGNLVNIGPLSHELAEWLDDPYGENDTPPWYWGNTGGQVTGCGEGLEVGDPMIGTFLPAIQMPNGISYQAQETAFFSWFFQQVPSLGFNGWYSSGGTFKSPAAICH